LSIRFFKYSSSSYTPLARNTKHDFAQKHALNIYNSSAIYSFIPKNGCSTLRTTIAYANGCIENPNDFNWIHSNNETFKASLSDLAKAKYTFTVLRCPLARLASVYLDKIVSRDPVAWNLYDLLDRKVDLDRMSFAQLIKSLRKNHVRTGNIHWRPQVDFLVYKSYDDYFSLHDFGTAVQTLKNKIDLEVIDARKLTKHGLDSISLVENECFAQTIPQEIMQMKREGFCPSPASLYNEESIDEVKKLYAEDLNLYREVIGDRGLLFGS
jgi:hypothetical protein